MLRVWDDHIVDWLLFVIGEQSASLGDLSLTETLHALAGFEYDVVLVIDLPDPVPLRLNSNNQEVDRDIWSLGDLLILLHETHNNICFLGDGEAELGIVEPSVVCVDLDVLVLVFFVWDGSGRVWSTS